MKVLELEALDGSKWLIPLSVITASYAAYLEKNYEHCDPEDRADRSRVDAAMCFDHTPLEAVEWAKSDMNWSEVRAHAVMVQQPDPVDMADSWDNGKMRVADFTDDEPDMWSVACGPITFNLDGLNLAEPKTYHEIDSTAGAQADQNRNPALAAWPFPTVKRVLTQADIDAIRDAIRLETTRGTPTVLEGVDAYRAKIVQASAAMTRDDLIALYDVMKADDVLAGVEPGDHGNAILEAYGRRVMAALIQKAGE